MRPLLTYIDVAQICGVTTRSVRRYVVRGLIHPIYITRKTVRFAESDVEKLIEGQGAGVSKTISSKAGEEIQQTSTAGLGGRQGRRHGFHSDVQSDKRSREMSRAIRQKSTEAPR